MIIKQYIKDFEKLNKKAKDELVQNLITDLQSHCKSVRVIGSYTTF